MMAQLRKKSIEKRHYVHSGTLQTQFNHLPLEAPPVSVDPVAFGFNDHFSGLKQAIDSEDGESIDALLNQYEAVLSRDDKNDLMVYAYLSGKKESLSKLAKNFQFEPDCLSKTLPFDADYLDVYFYPSKKDIPLADRSLISSGKAIFLFWHSDPDEFINKISVLYKSKRDGHIKESVVGKQFNVPFDHVYGPDKCGLVTTKAALEVVAAFDGITHISQNRSQKIAFKNSRMFVMMLTEAIQTNNLLLFDDLFRSISRPDIAVVPWQQLIDVCGERGKIRLLERLSQQAPSYVLKNKRANALLARSDRDSFELMSRTFDALEHVDFRGVALLLSMLSLQYPQQVDKVADDRHQPPVALLRSDYRFIRVREKIENESKFTKLFHLIYAHCDNFSSGCDWDDTVMSSGLTAEEEKLVKEEKAIFLIRQPGKHEVTIVFKPQDDVSQSVFTRVVEDREIHDDEAFERNVKLATLVSDSDGVAFTHQGDFSHFLEKVKNLSDKKSVVNCGFILQGSHTISGEISVRDGRATLLLFDSLGAKTPTEVSQLIESYFPKNDIYISKVALQHSGVGCNIFALINTVRLSQVEEILGFNPLYAALPKGERLLAYVRNNKVEWEEGMTTFMPPLCLALTKQGLSKTERPDLPFCKQGLLHLSEYHKPWEREKSLPCDIDGRNTLADYLENSRFVDRDPETGKMKNRTVERYFSIWGPRVVDWALKQEPEVLATIKTPAFGFK